MSTEKTIQLVSHLIGTPYVPAIELYINELTGCTVSCGNEKPPTLDDVANHLSIVVNPLGSLIQSFKLFG